MVHLNYRDARPIYLQIADSLRNQISAGILQPGDKLPSVRELAGTLAINPNTIQRAYRELESAGYIATITGKGCFVCAVADDSDTLWQALDSAVAQLMGRGVSRQALIEHLQQGGMEDA